MTDGYPDDSIPFVACVNRQEQHQLVKALLDDAQQQIFAMQQQKDSQQQHSDAQSSQQDAAIRAMQQQLDAAEQQFVAQQRHLAQEQLHLEQHLSLIQREHQVKVGSKCMEGLAHAQQI